MSDYELSESRKRHFNKNMSEFEALQGQKVRNSTENETKSDINDNISTVSSKNLNKEAKSIKSSKSSKSKKSKSKKSKKLRKSKSTRKMLPREAGQNEEYHSLNTHTISSNYNQKYQSLNERHQFHARSAHNNGCLTHTAPFNHSLPRTENEPNLHLNADLIDEENSNLIDPHQHHHKEDASNLAYPVNPFDHLMPHKNDFGTPNMAWIGDDGLVHTPCGGVYAKTTEAIANFRRELKYDSGWHRTRQRYICLILLIMFLTVCAVVVLLIERTVLVVDVDLLTHANVWEMEQNCNPNNDSVSQGCNVTIRSVLNVKIDNHNWVPATVNSWKVKHVFFCANTVVGCEGGGSEFGGNGNIKDGISEIQRKAVGSAVLNDSQRIHLNGCTLNPANGTYCEWEKSCVESNEPGHFVLELKVSAELSFALQSSSLIDTVVKLGTDCNGTAVLCKVDDVVKSDSHLCL